MKTDFKRPKTQSGEGATPTRAITRRANFSRRPKKETVKAKRDRAILSTLLYHALRREELCKLKVSDFAHSRRGVPHLKIEGKGEKMRFLPLHPGSNALIHDYLEAAGHGDDENGAPCSARLKTTAAKKPSIRRSHPMAFICSFKPVRCSSASRFVPMRCARPPLPTRSTTKPISPRSRSGSGMLTELRRLEQF